GKEVDDTLIESLSEMDRLRFEVRKLLKEGKKEEAEEKWNGLDGDEFEDVLLHAECCSPSKGMNLLVKAAKMNPRCSRAFYLLATILRGKNIVKAISLAERAASIRRGNEEYARLLDELMCENGEENEKRLIAMQRFVNHCSPVPDWTLISISRLLIQSNRVNDALLYLQEGIGTSDCWMRWALMGDVYSLRGQLSSSISAYKESLKRKHNLHVVVSMLSVSLRLGDFPLTISLCNEWMGEARDSLSPALTPILITLSQAILAICGDSISTHLPSLFIHINELVSVAPPSSILYKLFADSLLLLSKTNASIFSIVSQFLPSQWNIEEASYRISSVKLAVIFYSRCAKMSEEGSEDLSISLYLLFKLEGKNHILDRARKVLVHSIKLSVGKKKSRLWLLLAMIEEERGERISRIKHCLSRSLWIDPRNDEAWLRLGVLFFKAGEMKAASECIENSTKWNPLLSEGWSIWGEMAWIGGGVEGGERGERGRREGEDMMRHALSLHPTIWGVNRFSQMMCDRLAKGDKWSLKSNLKLIDIKRVMALRYHSSLSSKDDLLRLGILAELCGCYEEAKEIVEGVEGVGDSIHTQRNALVHSCFPSPSSSTVSYSSLSPLHKLCNQSTQRLKELVENCGCVMEPYRKKEEEGEENTKERLEYGCLNGDSIPLLVSAIITFGYDLGDDFISALHDLSPRDELIDYFPTVVGEEVDNGLRVVGKDGEESYRIHNEVARDVLAILKKKRQLLTVT
ncbi:hypothetical protein PENTCL1PPCAC_22730, partial [Pristionchus entomophagus]